MKIEIQLNTVFLILIFLFLPTLASANVSITEIMYDLEGADTGREWIEIFNDDEEVIDLTDWKLYESETNHKLSSSDLDNLIIPANSYAVIADNPVKFLTDWSDFLGLIFDSVFSLKNSGENLIIRDAELNDIDNVFYNPELGAKGDGNSLQKIDGNWVSAFPTPGAQNSSATDEEDPTSEPNEISDSGWPEYIPPEQMPSIKVYAGKDKTMIVGALGNFNGETLGLENKPLEGARFLWNFGDGTLKDGQNVMHFYRYPGEYKVVLDVSAMGQYTKVDSLKVKVIPNEVFISEIKTGIDSFVELQNKSKEEINISGWRFRSENQTFTFAKNSFIRPKSSLIIPVSSSGILFGLRSSKVELLYPGGFLADVFEYQPEEIKEIPKEIEKIPEVLAQVISPVTETEKEIQNDNEQETNRFKGQTAGIITIGDDLEKSNKLYYFLAVCALVIFSGLSIFLIRRNRSL